MLTQAEIGIQRGLGEQKWPTLTDMLKGFNAGSSTAARSRRGECGSRGPACRFCDPGGA